MLKTWKLINRGQPRNDNPVRFTKTNDCNRLEYFVISKIESNIWTAADLGRCLWSFDGDADDNDDNGYDCKRTCFCQFGDVTI